MASKDGHQRVLSSHWTQIWALGSDGWIKKWNLFFAGPWRVSVFVCVLLQWSTEDRCSVQRSSIPLPIESYLGGGKQFKTDFTSREWDVNVNRRWKSRDQQQKTTLTEVVTPSFRTDNREGGKRRFHLTTFVFPRLSPESYSSCPSTPDIFGDTFLSSFDISECATMMCRESVLAVG